MVSALQTAGFTVTTRFQNSFNNQLADDFTTDFVAKCNLIAGYLNAGTVNLGGVAKTLTGIDIVANIFDADPSGSATPSTSHAVLHISFYFAMGGVAIDFYWKHTKN